MLGTPKRAAESGVYARLIFWQGYVQARMSELELLPRNMVECAWCKDPKPVTETTWFMPEPGEKSVRLCSFCYEEARKQVRLIRYVKRRGEFPVEAAS
jgi:hypothetical protein